MPGDGINKPAIVVTVEQSPWLRDLRLDSNTISHTVELVGDIFSSGIAGHVREKFFTQSWATPLILPACLFQGSVDYPFSLFPS